MATYDENLNIIAEINSSNFPQYRNIRYNIGSIRKHTGELKDYFNKIFDKGTIINGSITYVLTPDNKLVEHYNPKTKITTFEQVKCFYFNQVIIRMEDTTDNIDSYLKYYKLQPYNDIIDNNPSASYNPNAKDKYRFVYTCQKADIHILWNKEQIYGLFLNGYYGINGWELLVRDPNFNPLNCYIFQKDGESKELFNTEYYQLTTKTRKLEKIDNSTINWQTGNTIQQVKFPGFYANNKSFIRFANQLTNDITQYKLADNKDINSNDVLPISSDNLGYEDLKNSKIVLFNGFDNNYELKNIVKTDDNIMIAYTDWTQNGITVTSNFQLRPKDKIYIVKRESSTVGYDNNNIYTSATYGPYNMNSSENFNLETKDFIYTLAFEDRPRICFTGPTIKPSWLDTTCNTIYLKFNNPELTGTYISNSTNTLSNLNFTTLPQYYNKLFVQASYNQEIVINHHSSYGNIVYEYNDFKLKNFEFISKNKIIKNQITQGFDFKVNNIKININGSVWKLQNGTKPIFNNFTINSSEVMNKSNCLSIVSTIDNKPGMLPSYINLLSEIDTNVLLKGWMVSSAYNGTLAENNVSVSHMILKPLASTTNGIHYDLKFAPDVENISPLLMRFGFESKTYVPSVGYIIFIELNN